MDEDVEGTVLTDSPDSSVEVSSVEGSSSILSDASETVFLTSFERFPFSVFK